MMLAGGLFVYVKFRQGITIVAVVSQDWGDEEI